jgi:hypothetical protein
MRRELIPEEVADRRRSVRWFARPDSSSPLKGKLLQFYQDVQVRVVPYGGRANQRPDFRVRSEPATKVATDAVLRAITACTDTPSGELQGDVCDFITNETVRLLLYGRVVHEIVVDAGRRYFFPLPPGWLLPFGPRVGQVVPPNPFEKSGRRIVWLERSNLWWVTPPRGLGGRVLSRLRNVLTRVNSIPPSWSLPSIEQPMTDFDLSAFVYKSDVVVAKAVRIWGWPIGNPSQRQMTNYHHLREHLRFSITMARIREHLLGELNRQLALGPHPAAVIVEGIPSAADLTETFGQFASGSITFADAIASTQW